MAILDRDHSPISIVSLRGGQNNTDPPTTLPNDQCVLAENVEFWLSALGERRAGMAGASLTGSGIDTSYNAIVHISERFPTNDPNVGELWIVGATETVTSAWAYRDDQQTWFAVTPDDALDTSIPNVYRVQATGFNAKHFFAYNSPGVDRLHVWDGTFLRRTGLAQPVAAPTVANEGSGTYATARYFRFRYIEMSGSTILRRSEPSASVVITPSGSGAGITVTRAALLGEHETHWEVEESLDDAVYYVIATVPVATTTYNDELADPTLIAQTGDLSEAVGEYLLQPACRRTLVDGNRLIMLGHFTDLARKCRVSWTPNASAFGVGNDERLPLSTLADNGNDSVDLDNYEGGEITDGSDPADGVFYIFKWSAIYQATRTNTQGATGAAYTIICLTKARGALPGSVVSGADEYGQACIYFLDPLVGPSRLTPGDLQIVRGLRKTWARVNRLATGIVAHGVYYPDKRQTHWWVAVDSSNYPNLELVLQANETTETDKNEVARGWSLATGHRAEAYCSAIVNVEILDSEGDVATISRRPYLGFSGSSLLQQSDLLSQDDGIPYAARIVTRPYLPSTLLGKWGVMAAALLADPSQTISVQVSVIRDFGAETQSVITDLLPTSTQTEVVKLLDNLRIAEATSIQFSFADVP